MIRDITIGQYYPAQSPIHKLDPRVKLFATLIYIIALFSYKGIAGVLFIVAALAAVIKISKVPFKFMVKGLKSIIILLLFTACFSVFFTQGEYTIWEYGILHISDTGLINAATMMYCIPTSPFCWISMRTGADRAKCSLQCSTRSLRERPLPNRSAISLSRRSSQWWRVQDESCDHNGLPKYTFSLN